MLSGCERNGQHSRYRAGVAYSGWTSVIFMLTLSSAELSGERRSDIRILWSQPVNPPYCLPQVELAVSARVCADLHARGFQPDRGDVAKHGGDPDVHLAGGRVRVGGSVGRDAARHGRHVRPRHLAHRRASRPEMIGIAATSSGFDQACWCTRN